MERKILLFIPMYNCEKQITRVLSQINNENKKYFSQIIIVNNRSTDNGEQAVTEYCKKHSELPIKLLRNDENYGLGGSHKVAFDYAVQNGFDYVVVLHGDDQGDISNLVPYLETKEYEEYDCFLGARFMKGSKLQGYSKFRTFGNYVYNFLFTLGTGCKIYDLGSGLNMYKVAILKDKFYGKYIDNLMFNYCMIMGASYYKHKIKFFPILWREEDQISNVKLSAQAIKVLKLLLSFVLNRKQFITAEHRTEIIENYNAQVIYESK